MTRVAEALEKARALAAIDVVSLGDVDRKARLHARDDGRARAARCRRRRCRRRRTGGGWWRGQGVLDALARVDGQSRRAQRASTMTASSRDERSASARLAEVRDQAQFWLDTGRPELALDRRCLHWPLAFPEVFLAPGRSGFDAIVGNPPFLGGQRITGALGTRIATTWSTCSPPGVEAARTSSPTSSFVRSRCCRSRWLRPAGDEHDRPRRHARGGTRSAGRARREQSPARCRASRGRARRRWKLRRSGCGRANGADSACCPASTGPCDLAHARHSRPRRRQALSFEGERGQVFHRASIVLGMGFVMTPEEAQALIDRDPRNREVLFPYLNGEDLELATGPVGEPMGDQLPRLAARAIGEGSWATLT